MEGIIKELGEWTNADYDYLLYSLIDHKDRDFNILANYALKAIQALNDEKEKNKEKLKKLEVDKKFKEYD